MELKNEKKKGTKTKRRNIYILYEKEKNTKNNLLRKNGCLEIIMSYILTERISIHGAVIIVLHDPAGLSPAIL